MQKSLTPQEQANALKAYAMLHTVNEAAAAWLAAARINKVDMSDLSGMLYAIAKQPHVKAMADKLVEAFNAEHV